jgi:hypothetical protein
MNLEADEPIDDIMFEELMRDHWEYWQRGKMFLHIPAVRQAMGWLLQPNPYTGEPIVPPTCEGFPDYEAAYRMAINDLGLERYH